MKRTLIGLMTAGTVAAVAIFATGAFFQDNEVSTGNTFTAGALDLTVDNNCTYNGEPCPESENNDASWESTDLGAQHKFFYFTDVKPGDEGEDTVSLTVDNDAWVRLLVKDVTNNDVSCTDPEEVAESGDCGTDPDAGELRQTLLFNMWLDQGATTGFQGLTDDGEGDNIQQEGEPTLISEGTIDPEGETWNLADFGDLYLIGGQHAYFGIAWNLPEGTGNEVQSDSMTATMEIQVEQHRNNPTPFL